MLIYLIKIPLPALTKGYLSHHKCAPLDIFFSLNSKDYLSDWLQRCDGCGRSGKRGIYWRVRKLARLLSTVTAGQISSRHTTWPGDRSTLAIWLQVHSWRGARGHQFSAVSVATAGKINCVADHFEVTFLGQNPTLGQHCRKLEKCQQIIFSEVDSTQAGPQEDSSGQMDGVQWVGSLGGAVWCPGDPKPLGPLVTRDQAQRTTVWVCSLVLKVGDLQERRR